MFFRGATVLRNGVLFASRKWSLIHINDPGWPRDIIIFVSKGFAISSNARRSMMRMISRRLFVVAGVFSAGTLLISAQAQPLAKNGQQPANLDGARDAIIRAIGAEKDTVAIVTTAKTATVERINSNMNGSSHGARNNEAIVIGPIVSQAIADKPEFKGVVVIRVQYLRRSSPGSKAEVVDTVEFRKDAGGKFQFHET
jgi:hypothetical protein